MMQSHESAPSGRAVVPPFRADHVGSLLRPPELKMAREKLLGPHTAEANIGPHDNAALRAVEDQHIRDAIAMQKRVGLRTLPSSSKAPRAFG